MKLYFFIVSLFVALIIAFFLDFGIGITRDSNNWLSNVAVEFHGLIFDIILFGIVLTLFESFANKSLEIKRYNEELDDYRNWNEPEALHRINGIIKRLNKLGYRYINIDRLLFENFRINNWYISGQRPQNSVFSFFSRINNSQYSKRILDPFVLNFSIKDCRMFDCEFNLVKFSLSEYKDVAMNNVSFVKCDFFNTNFSFQKASNVIFRDCLFSSNSTSIVTISYSDIGFMEKTSFGINFRNCRFKGINFEKIFDFPGIFTNCTFKDCKGVDSLLNEN